MTCASVRRVGLVCLGLLLLGTGPTALAADGAVGDWKLSIASPEGQEFTPTLKIAAGGDKTSGVFVGDDGAETECKEVKIDGNKLIVSVARDFGGQELSLKFDGAVSGDDLKGTVEYDLGGSVGTLDFTGKRLGAAAAASGSVAGTWNVVATTPDGQTFEPSLKLEEKDGKIGGEFIWVDGQSFKVNDVVKMGDTFTFGTSIDFGGQALKITFNGKMVSADKVTGTAEYDLDGQTGTVDFEGTRQKPSVNLSGKWNAVATTPDGQSFEPSVDLKHDGDKITGDFIWVDGTSVPLTTGKLAGDDVTFDVSVDFGGQALVIKFAGKLDGADKMKGSAEYDLGGQTGTVDFEATRAKAVADLTGKWNAVATTPDGQSFEPSVVLKQDGEKVSGDFIWVDGTSVPLTTGKVAGEDVTFDVSVDFGGQALVIKFAGKMTGPDSMKGSAEYDLGGQTGTVDFEAKRDTAVAQVAGFWNAVATMPDGQTFEPSVKLTQDGDKVGGELIWIDGTSAPLTTGKVTGNNVDFDVSVDFGGQALVIKFHAVNSGDTMKGTADYDLGGQTGTVDFEAKRGKEMANAAAGDWNFTITMDDGRNIETSLTLKDDAGKLSGKYAGPAGESDVSDAKLDGDKLSFSVKRERDGREFTMKYVGAVSGDEVKGDVEFDFGDQNGKVPFTGKRAK